MIQSLVGVVAVLAFGHALWTHSGPAPKDVPPVVGMAVVSDQGKVSEFGEWNIKLSVPKIAWEVIGEKNKLKMEWPEIKAEVQMTTLTLRMAGPESLQASRVVDMKGKDLTREQVIKRLETETPVLVSVSGGMPDAYYLQLTNADALIVLLGARDGSPAPELLPAPKSSLPKAEKAK